MTALCLDQTRRLATASTIPVAQRTVSLMREAYGSMFRMNIANMWRHHQQRTPLHWAIATGNLATMKLLLEKGADSCVVDSKGYDAMAYAKLKGSDMAIE